MSVEAAPGISAWLSCANDRNIEAEKSGNLVKVRTPNQIATRSLMDNLMAIEGLGLEIEIYTNDVYVFGGRM